MRDIQEDLQGRKGRKNDVTMSYSQNINIIIKNKNKSRTTDMRSVIFNYFNG